MQPVRQREELENLDENLGRQGADALLWTGAREGLHLSTSGLNTAARGLFARNGGVDLGPPFES